jgi:hypothetical protein
VSQLLKGSGATIDGGGEEHGVKEAGRLIDGEEKIGGRRTEVGGRRVLMGRG